MNNDITTSHFELGNLVITNAAARAIHGTNVQAYDIVRRHVAGDWGTADAKANEAALDGSGILISIFDVSGTELWVFTEADRSTTTVIAPK